MYWRIFPDRTRREILPNFWIIQWRHYLDIAIPWINSWLSRKLFLIIVALISAVRVLYRNSKPVINNTHADAVIPNYIDIYIILKKI